MRAALLLLIGLAAAPCSAQQGDAGVAQLLRSLSADYLAGTASKFTYAQGQPAAVADDV